MSKIKVLDSSITNRISAGEVVEKPASIVKELLENSIDAKATRITIEIENGGTTKIAITDNGEGIDKNDLILALSPHATSKISIIDDLDCISTLGFRGEALSSIVAVSKVSLQSKTNSQEIGGMIKSSGGIIEKQIEIACQAGTFIEVNSLFFNTPVRAKFLRKAKTEEADITDYVERIMLAFPHISFKYVVDGKIKYNTNGSGLLDNIYTIYGKEVANNLIEVNFKKDNYTITGFFGKPQIAKPNRNYQTLLISNRYVKNYMVSSAIQKAFENYLMKNKFPFYVLNLTLPFDNVDVNVHPNKLEVKFENPNQIYSLFYSSAIEALSKIDESKNIELIKEEYNITQKVIDKNEGASFSEPTKVQEVKQETMWGVQTNLNDQSVKENPLTFSKSSISNKIIEVEIKPAESIIKEEITSNGKDNTILDVVNYKIVGTLFNTYNIIESENMVYFVDQHAGHERILYDKYMQELKTQTLAIQELITPFVINVKDTEADFLRAYSSLLIKCGFDFFEFGQNIFKVSSIPYIFASVNLEEFFSSLLADFNEYKKQPIEYLKHAIATKACKAAVKAGNKLTDEEIKILFENIKNGILLCPHGRPFVMKLEKLQVEKWFKRVL